jgi:hypothetical protein
MAACADQAQSPSERKRHRLDSEPSGLDRSVAVIQKARFFDLVLLCLAFFSTTQDSVAQVNPNTGSQSSSGITGHPLYGPGEVYAKIPTRDELGRDQLAMFHVWNPDPVGHHQANLRALNPILAKVVWKAQADNPGHRFVIGSGKRNGRLQRMTLAWGWSRTQNSPHQSGDAVDLWPLDQEGQVFFDRTAQNKITSVMKKAAAELGMSIRWGGHSHGFRNSDRSHFELARP